ncbi:hypothetical protein EVAR_93914_1 [Eumeta japonica]|uniref:Uncharacterized protein n=1 Tax=Eumeta variegata TaxID=151549 RepID=A0A4C1TP31_EUMVA|nr:hypothetical protein EVAR_93914_1 [Eumeta japonica]
MFLDMANECLELGYFPCARKVPAIKIIPKPGKDDYARPKSHQPINLLPLLGKTVKRSLTPPIALYTKAISDTALKTLLLVYKCSVNLYGMVQGYLRDREVIERYPGRKCRKTFANDVVLVFSRQMTSPVEEDTFRTLAHVYCWRFKTKLKCAPSKTNSMVLTIKFKCDDPVVDINREQAYSAICSVYLGTGDREAWLAEDTRRCSAQRRSQGMLGSLYSLPTFCADPLKAASSRYQSMRSSLCMSRAAHLYRQKPNREQGQHGPYGMTRRRGDLVLDATIQSFLDGLLGGDDRAVKSYNKGEKQRDLFEIIVESRVVCLFWVRAYARIAGKEPAIKFARRATLTKYTAVNYNKFPLYYTKKVIRAVNLDESQKRYAERGTGEINKSLFP